MRHGVRKRKQAVAVALSGGPEVGRSQPAQGRRKSRSR
jgi:hypothetical protein